MPSLLHSKHPSIPGGNHCTEFCDNHSCSEYVPLTPIPSGLLLGAFETLCLFGTLRTQGGFPVGSVVKNLPANAEDTGSYPWSGETSHTTEQLRPSLSRWACALESGSSDNSWAHMRQLLKPDTPESALHSERGPPSHATAEKACTAVKT